MSTTSTPDWRKAKCIGTDTDKLFFGTNVKQINLTKELFCDRCPIQQECIDYAISEKLRGIWGTSEASRNRIAQMAGKPMSS